MNDMLRSFACRCVYVCACATFFIALRPNQTLKLKSCSFRCGFYLVDTGTHFTFGFNFSDVAVNIMSVLCTSSMRVL